MSATRRLAGILAADVAGYSRLMGADEEGTHERLKAHRRELARRGSTASSAMRRAVPSAASRRTRHRGSAINVRRHRSTVVARPPMAVHCASVMVCGYAAAAGGVTSRTSRKVGTTG
jgi:hypothetical protein